MFTGVPAQHTKSGVSVQLVYKLPVHRIREEEPRDPRVTEYSSGYSVFFNAMVTSAWDVLVSCRNNNSICLFGSYCVARDDELHRISPGVGTRLYFVIIHPVVRLF